MFILGTQSERFKNWHNRQGAGRNNGSYWYSRELEEIILPEIDINLFIVTAGAKLYQRYEVPDGAVILCHDNRNTVESYKKFFNKNVLWICSKHSTVKTLKNCGENAVYIPLSIDTKYVKKFKTKKTKKTAFVGNAWGFKKSYLDSLPKDITQLNGLERDDLLKEMAKFKHVIAEGRCLMEAQVLGAKTEVPKYDNLESVYVEAFDSHEAIPLLRKALVKHEKAQEGKCIMRSMVVFKDLKSLKTRRIGEVFMVSSDRANELLSNALKLVERL